MKNMLIEIKNKVVSLNCLLILLVIIGTISTLNYSNVNDQTISVFIWIAVMSVLAIKKRSLANKELSERSAIIVFLIAIIMLFATIRNTSDPYYINSTMIVCVIIISSIIALEIYDFQHVVFGTLFGFLLLTGIASIIFASIVAEVSIANSLMLFLFFIYGNLTLIKGKQQLQGTNQKTITFT